MEKIVTTIVLSVLLFIANTAFTFYDASGINLYGIKLAMTPEEVMGPLQELFPGKQADLREKDEKPGVVEYEIHISEPRKEIWLTFNHQKRLVWAEYIMKYKKGFSAAESELVIKDTVQRYGPYDDICTQKSLHGDRSVEMVWGSMFKKWSIMGMVVHTPDFDAGPVFTISFPLEDSQDPFVSFNLIDSSSREEATKGRTKEDMAQDEERTKQKQPSQEDQESVKQLVSIYYKAIQDKQVDRAMDMYATEAKPRIIRKRIEAVATDTEYYRIDGKELTHLDENTATALVRLRHKKYGLDEECWEINFNLVKEDDEWKILSTPGKRLPGAESEQLSQGPVAGQEKPTETPQGSASYTSTQKRDQPGETEQNTDGRIFRGSSPWGDVVIRVDSEVFRHFNIDDIKTKLDPGYSNYRYSNPHRGGSGQWQRTGGMGARYMLVLYFKGAIQGTMRIEFNQVTTMGQHNDVQPFMKEAFYEGMGDLRAACFIAGEPWNEAVVHWVPAASSK